MAIESIIKLYYNLGVEMNLERLIRYVDKRGQYLQ